MSDNTSADLPAASSGGPAGHGQHIEAVPEGRRSLLSGGAGRNVGLVVALLLVCLIGWLTADALSSFEQARFGTVQNALTILRQASIIGVMSIGMTFVITAGGIDLSVGSVAGLASVLAAVEWVSKNQIDEFTSEPRSWLIMIGAGLLAGLVAGLINGYLIAYGKVVAFIATLAMLISAKGVAELISTRRTIVISNADFKSFFLWNPFNEPGWNITLIVIFIVVAVLGWVLFNRTTFGRRTVAIGGNPEAARLAGINIRRHLVYVYMIAGLCAAIGGLMLAGRTSTGTATHGLYYELDAIAAVVVGGTLLIGGRGTIVGTVLGVLIFATLTNIFTQNNLDSSTQNALRGAIIVVAVILQQRLASRSRTTARST